MHSSYSEYTLECVVRHQKSSSKYFLGLQAERTSHSVFSIHNLQSFLSLDLSLTLSCNIGASFNVFSNTPRWLGRGFNLSQQLHRQDDDRCSSTFQFQSLTRLLNSFINQFSKTALPCPLIEGFNPSHSPHFFLSELHTEFVTVPWGSFNGRQF